MSFRDQWVTEEDGTKWVFTVEMQRRLSDAGLPVEPAALAELGDDPQPAAASQSYDRREERSRRDDGPRDDRSRRRESSPEALEPATIQIDPETGKYLGRLKWYNAVRGYGFIARGGGTDIFFHKTDVAVDPENLPEGQWLLYDVEETNKGLEASEIELYEGEPQA